MRCSPPAPSISRFGDFLDDRPSDRSFIPPVLSSAPPFAVFRAQVRVDASVVAGLGVAVYGFSPSPGPVDLFSSPAHAQVNNEVRKVERRSALPTSSSV